MEKNTQTRKITLDFARLLACISVVFIHVRISEPAADFLEYVTNFAVPLFFMTSGYFWYHSDDRVFYQKGKKSITKLLKLLIISAIGYTIVNIVLCTTRAEIREYLYLFIKPTTWIKFLAMNDTDIFAVQLWFIPASIYGYVFWMLARRMKFEKVCYGFIPILLLFGTLVKYMLTGTQIDTWHLEGDWIFRSIPYMGTGLLLSRYSNICSKFNRKFLIVLTIVGCVMQSVPKPEYWMINPMILATYVYSVGVFLIATNEHCHVCGEFEKLGEIGRTCATTVYLIHIAIYKILSRVIFELEFTIDVNLMPIIVAIVSLTIAMVKNKMAVYKKYQ